VITYQWYAPKWWRRDPTHGNCTIEQRESVLNNSLAVNFIVSDLLQEIQETTMGLVNYYESDSYMYIIFI